MLWFWYVREFLGYKNMHAKTLYIHAAPFVFPNLLLFCSELKKTVSVYSPVVRVHIMLFLYKAIIKLVTMSLTQASFQVFEVDSSKL